MELTDPTINRSRDLLVGLALLWFQLEDVVSLSVQSLEVLS